MPEKVKITKLETGWTRVGFAGGFAQFPSDFRGDTIPDEYIFQPSWNRERVNLWWRSYRDA